MNWTISVKECVFLNELKLPTFIGLTDICIRLKYFYEQNYLKYKTSTSGVIKSFLMV